jgi:hypothetical protein
MPQVGLPGPDVRLLGGHVQVPAHDHLPATGVGCRAQHRQPGGDRVKEPVLGVLDGRARGAGRHVHADDGQALAVALALAPALVEVDLEPAAGTVELGAAQAGADGDGRASAADRDTVAARPVAGVVGGV